MSARRTVVALTSLVMAAGLVLATSCGISSDEEPRFQADADVPFDLLGTAPPGTAPPSSAIGGTTTRVCLSGADARVHPVERALPPGYDLLDLVDVLIAGPTDPERSYGLTSAIGEPGTVTEISVEGGVATVDLDPAIEALATTDQLTVVTQLVCTLTEQPGVGQVRFTVDGVSITVIRGDGSTTLDPVSREDYDVLIAPTG